jgi:uncharacterized protein (DUF924 family)
MSQREIIDYWMGLPDKALFTSDPAFDAELQTRFGELHTQAVNGLLDDWAETKDGRFALILLLDQMSRNLKRGTPAMFAADPKALALAAQAIALGDDEGQEPTVKRWYYMPFMHSEQFVDQERCVELCRQPGLENTLQYAIDHRDIVARFGRFPHRNKVLGRAMKPGEQAFLDEGGFSG